MLFHRESPRTSIRIMPVFATIALALWLAIAPAIARATSLVRDPDIEYALAKVAAPILQAAGMGSTLRVLMVNDNSLNAFVIDRQHIFINSGMLTRMKSPDMLQAVIAHEVAHITNGHLTRRVTNIGGAQSIAKIGLLLALAAAAATGEAGAAAGIALGVQSAAQRIFLSHTREEESAADQSGARYMARAGADLKGAVAIHEMFRGQELLNVSRQDPYMRSHPLTRDRIRAMKSFAATYAKEVRPDSEITYWFERAKGKTTAFLRSPKWTRRRAADSATKDIELMRLAIAHHREANKTQAIATLDKAIALRPDDAFFWELKGQILLESRQFGAAVKAYRRSTELAPGNALCLGGYGRALLAAGQPKEALTALEKARARDHRDVRVLRDLGAAYAQTGNNGMASLATAERYALQGRLKDAGIHARRAAALLPEGSNGWRRAQDVILAANRVKDKKK